MSFGWINLANATSVVCLIIINIMAAKKNIAGDFKSKYRIINFFEQVGRYGCMFLMVIPFAIQNWEFGFHSITGMIIWLCLTMILLIIYAFLWTIKVKGGKATLYGLAIIPICLFLTNGILLHHIFLTVFALIFGVCHITIVKENVD